MIKRISDIPFWGPEEQIRKFINQHDDHGLLCDITLELLRTGENVTISPDAEINDKQQQLMDVMQRVAMQKLGLSGTYSTLNSTNKASVDAKVKEYEQKYMKTQLTVSQDRIQNLDDIFQRQLIWSYEKHVDDAYFYWDWCPIGTGQAEDPKWQIVAWEEYPYNKGRDIDRTFKYQEIVGYTNSRSADEMVREYDARTDLHAKDGVTLQEPDITMDVNVLRHNIMRSYLEVSEWLGDGATEYGSHNGFVSRKMSLSWLFNAIKALINWKLENHDKWAEVNIHPLDIGTWDETNKKWVYQKDENGNNICERFLNRGESSTQCAQATASVGESYYSDNEDLDQVNGRCGIQKKCRANEPWKNGVLKVRGNEFHYGERADFYTHNSFIGECRFFHNARFLGQTTFDKEINGTAMRSRWADLAEYKESDSSYLPGTLVMFGGEKEITIAKNGKANAIVTTKPGLVLNGENHPEKIMVGIALTGTVPVKIAEKVKKFDKLVASKKYPGYARRRRWYEFWKRPIAIALQSWPAGGMINCITKMEF